MDPKAALDSFFDERNVLLHAVVPFDACRVINEALLRREIPRAMTAILYALPYRTGEEPDRNLSLYACGKDYHLLLKEMNAELILFLKTLFPDGSFAGYGDRSPIDERAAFASAGLGVIGDNGLLITEEYGSYVFLGETLTDVPPGKLGAAAPGEAKGCLHCGACKRACPYALSDCASGVSQKKGELTEEEEKAVLKTGLIWGCDLCQTCCPLNSKTKTTPLGFFYEDRITRLTREGLDAMSTKELRARAFGWHGRQPLQRNIALYEKNAARGEKKEDAT